MAKFALSRWASVGGMPKATWGCLHWQRAADPAACRLVGGGGAAGNLTFLAVALHRKAGEALAPLPPTTSGVLHGGQSLGATSFLWPHVLPAGMHAGNKKVVRPPAGMAFRYFLSRVALMKISTLRFLTGEVEPMGRSRGKLPVLLAVSALPQLSPCCGWGGPTHPAGLWGAQ